MMGFQYLKLRVPRRRGMALVMVLGLLAITLGFSYALLRSHAVDHELERNQSRRIDARTAAQAGLAVALRKLYDDTWSGADTTFAGNLSTDNLQGFTATYTTGDGSLTSSLADWSEYPFRLTIDSKGYSIDPSAASSRSEYTIRVVVQLIRRKLNTSLVKKLELGEPDIERYSIYQSANTPVRIHYPIRINDSFRLQGELEFSRRYPRNYLDLQYFKLFSDLQSMYAANNAWDYRPFNGRLFTPSTRQPIAGDVVSVLDAKLFVPRSNVGTSGAPPVPTVSAFSGYRLYAKGKNYPGQAVATIYDSQDVVPNADYLVTAGTYAPDPQLNPLGVFTSIQGSIGFSSNTSLQGMLLAYATGDSADVHVGGTNITLQGSTLPALTGDALIYRLPAVIAQDDVRVYDGTNRTVNGWVVCGDEFQLYPGASSTTFTVNGGIFCNKLYLDERSTWKQGYSEWQDAYDQYNGRNSLVYKLVQDAITLLLGPTELAQNDYFPGWLNNHRKSWGIYLAPRLIFNATPNGVKNHMPDLAQPIYVGHSDDSDKLLWDILRWQEIGAS